MGRQQHGEAVALGEASWFLGVDSARIFGGDIGRSRSRIPAAAWIALATAAIGGTIGTSPTPPTPNGCRGFGTSTITASI